MKDILDRISQIFLNLFLTMIFCRHIEASNDISMYENYCDQKYIELTKNYQTQTLNQVLDLWKKNVTSSQCPYGLYEYYIADIYSCYQQYDQAKKTLVDGINSFSLHTKKLDFLLGIVYSNINSPQEYKSLIDIMITQDSHWFGGYAHLGAYYTLYNKDYFAAKEALIKALSLVDTQNSYYVLCTLASVEHVLNNDEMMTKYFVEAAAINWRYTAHYSNYNLAIAVIYYNSKIGNLLVPKNILYNLERIDDGIVNNHEYIKAKNYYQKMLEKSKSK